MRKFNAGLFITIWVLLACVLSGVADVRVNGIKQPSASDGGDLTTLSNDVANLQTAQALQAADIAGVQTTQSAHTISIQNLVISDAALQSQITTNDQEIAALQGATNALNISVGELKTNTVFLSDVAANTSASSNATPLSSADVQALVSAIPDALWAESVTGVLTNLNTNGVMMYGGMELASGILTLSDTNAAGYSLVVTGSVLTANIDIGRNADDVVPILTMRGDEDSDSAATSYGSLITTLVPSAAPAFAYWRITSDANIGLSLNATYVTLDAALGSAGDGRLYIKGGNTASDMFLVADDPGTDTAGGCGRIIIGGPASTASAPYGSIYLDAGSAGGYVRVYATDTNGPSLVVNTPAGLHTLADIAQFQRGGTNEFTVGYGGDLWTAGSLQRDDFVCEADFIDGASQTFTNGGYTAITNFANNRCDAGFSSDGTQATVSNAGWYEVGMTLSFAGDGAATIECYLYTNGAQAVTVSGQGVGWDETMSAASVHKTVAFKKLIELAAGTALDFRIETGATEVFTWDHGTVWAERK